VTAQTRPRQLSGPNHSATAAATRRWPVSKHADESVSVVSAQDMSLSLALIGVRRGLLLSAINAVLVGQVRSWRRVPTASVERPAAVTSRENF
jgi:hypothetical protein